MSYSTSVDWRTLVFDEQWMQRLERLASKRFGAGGLAEEAASYVIEKISENDWAVFQSYKGQSKPETYLHTLTGNFLEEFSRKRFGRPRPPEWVKREGEVWVRVWKMICLERGMPQSVVDILCLDDSREESFIRQIIQTLKARIPWCGESSREISTPSTAEDDGGTALEELIPEYMTPDAEMEEAHFQSVLQMLSLMFNTDGVTPADVENSADKAKALSQQESISGLRQFGSALDLSDEEWVVMRMVFESGLKYRDVADRLGMKQHEPGRICKRALEKVAQALHSAGIEKDNIINMLL